MGEVKIATWNVGSLYVDFNENIGCFRETILTVGADLFCMQEFPVRKDMVDEVMSVGGFAHYKLLRTSESHVFKENDMGVAIFSKHPVKQIDLIELPKPGIKAVREGREEKWHSKFFTINLCKTESEDIVVITGHGFPFHRYGLERAEYYEIISGSFSALDFWISDFLEMSGSARVYLSADFNLTNPLDFMPRCREKYYDAFAGDPTRPSGRKTDAIILPKGCRLIEKINLSLRADEGTPFFDHNCIGARIEI